MGINQAVFHKQLRLNHLTPSAVWSKPWSFAAGIDQDQTAQNVQSDLDLRRPLVKSDICDTVICGTLWILFTVVERGRF